jgi:hypothetical protein
VFWVRAAYDNKPKRRLFELLKSQGMQQNQQVVFLSDGGDDVRDLPMYLSPESEHWLDWFHVTMRLTVLGQQAKGVKAENAKLAEEAERSLERIKHYLWHGNVFQALQEIQGLEIDLGLRGESELVTSETVERCPRVPDLCSQQQELRSQLRGADRHGERISTALAESTINQVISKRFAKRQQMQWTPRGAHLLLQTRTRVLNGDLEQTFRGWYAGFRPQSQASEEVDSAA